MVCLITNEPFWDWPDEKIIMGPFNHFFFVDRDSRKMNGDRKTIAVCHCHNLGLFPLLRRSNIWTSFLPDHFRTSAKALSKRSSTLFLTYFWNQRWQVWCGGYRSGISTLGDPDFRIQRMPFKASCGSLGGRPRNAPVKDFGIFQSVFSLELFHIKSATYIT
jgi:hypothetical protein